MDKKVSIIIPVYRAEATLRRCVESLVYGTYRNLEVILIEDCSPDNSGRVCRELVEEHTNIQYLKNTENSGVSYTRNRGLTVATGEYILFVDSDDWVSGRYVETLVKASDQQEAGTMVACGFHFLDRLNNHNVDYIWSEGKQGYSVVDRKDFFRLPDKVMLQQLWNKVFLHSVIEEAQLQFDETQSRGEGFEFVLDYMKAADIRRYVMINEPLYYYIRANSTSLMSKFGLVENQDEYKRWHKLLELCGEDDPAQVAGYEQAIIGVKNNTIYRVARSDLSKEKKEEVIRELTGEADISAYLKRENKVILKERTAAVAHKVRIFPLRVQGRLHRIRIERKVRRVRATLQNRDFTVLAQNCIGGVFYHDMGLQFTSPTINLFFTAPDFIRFVKGLDHYLNSSLSMTWGEQYPIGQLDDITIHFMHYDNCKEAYDAWMKRKERIRRDKIVVLCSDMEDFTEATYEEWKTVPYKKVLFSAMKKEDESVLWFPQYERQGKVGDLISERAFYKDGRLLELVNQ